MRVSTFVLGILLASMYTGQTEAQEKPDNLDVKLKTLDILESDEIAAAIGACIEKDPALPKRLSLEIEVGIDGRARLANLAPQLGPQAKQCIEKLIAATHFAGGSEAYRVIHRFGRLQPCPVAPAPGKAAAPPGPQPVPVAGKEVKEKAHQAREIAGLTDRDNGRIVYMPTAIPRPRGKFNATAHDIGFWQLEYGVTDNFDLGGQFLLPITVFSIAPNMRFGFKLRDKVWLGGYATFGLFIPYIEGIDFEAIFYGGGLTLTAGDNKFLFNAGLVALGITAFSSDESETRALLLPNAGLSIRLSSMVRLNFELVPPLMPSVDAADDASLWLILYGLRISGDTLYGDISFIWPAMKDAWTFMKYMPMGMPMLSFGFQL